MPNLLARGCRSADRHAVVNAGVATPVAYSTGRLMKLGCCGVCQMRWVAFW